MGGEVPAVSAAPPRPTARRRPGARVVVFLDGPLRKHGRLLSEVDPPARGLVSQGKGLHGACSFPLDTCAHGDSRAPNTDGRGQGWSGGLGLRLLPSRDERG